MEVNPPFEPPFEPLVVPNDNSWATKKAKLNGRRKRSVPSDNEVQNDSVLDDVVPSDALRTEAVLDAMVQTDSVVDDVVPSDAVRTEAVQDVVVQTEAV